MLTKIRAIAAAHDLSELFTQTLEQAVDAVIVIDANNDVLLFNAAAERLWGRSRTEVLGRNVNLLVPEEIRHLHDGYVERNRHTRLDRIVGTSRDVPIPQADGSQRWGSMSISRIELENETLYTAFVKDVTERHAQQEKLRLLSLVADHSNNAVIITDAKARIIYVNTGFQRLFGYPPQAIRARNPITLLSPHPDRRYIRRITECLAQGTAYQGEEIVQRQDGQRLWCSITTNPVHLHGQLSHSVSVLTDITGAKVHEMLQRRMLEAMLHDESLEVLMEQACLEVERIDPNLVVSILQVTEQGLLRPLAAPKLPTAYSSAIDGVAIGPRVGACGSAAYLRRPVFSDDIENDPHWDGFRDLLLPLGLCSCWSTPMMGSDGRVLGTFALYYRERQKPSAQHMQLLEACRHLCVLALEREESRSRIRQLALYDTLTGLANRSQLLTRAAQALADANRARQPVAVLFIDLDRFKQVNDSLGHSAGDRLLQVVAHRLNQQRRSADIVARQSGDEFVMVVPGCEREQVALFAERLLQALRTPCMIAGTSITPSASVGISLYPEDGGDIATLIRHADMAMYQAKAQERGRFRLFNHELTQALQQRLELEKALREALQQQGLSLVYQPQMHIGRQALYGVEALLRWHSPELGSVSPCTFIPLAEDCGLIEEIGQWVVAEACRQLAAWRERGIDVPCISVNLSPSNFHNPLLPSLISQALEANRLPAQALTLEITEGVLMDENPISLTTLDAIHRLGVRLSMDDFGTGYSSLSYLRRLPIQELKLDRSFVYDLEHDRTNQALSEAVIRLGESLDLTVVAEGIETQSQYNVLARQGYHVAQGFLLARPLAADALEQWVANGCSQHAHA